MSSVMFLLYPLVLSIAHASLLNNYIIGVPTVHCEENDVSLDVITAKPFEGNIFVKGRAKDSECKHSYGSNNTKAFALGLGKCGMQRLRSVNPRGISFTVTVIVSFHPKGFITKNDRAFHIKCFYMEPEEVVTNQIKVSALPTYELQDEMGMPQCQYSVHMDAIDGPLLNLANVGDTVFHVWECTGSPMGMVVKKCFVTDGDGEEHLVINEMGCSMDQLLIDQVVYEEGKMVAWAKSQVFKYADSNQLFFTCQIRLCQLQMGMCDKITPPRCNETADESKFLEMLENSLSTDEDVDNSTSTRRRRRSLRGLLDLDVASGELMVMDYESQFQVRPVCSSPGIKSGFVAVLVVCSALAFWIGTQLATRRRKTVA